MHTHARTHAQHSETTSMRLACVRKNIVDRFLHVLSCELKTKTSGNSSRAMRCVISGEVLRVQHPFGADPLGAQKRSLARNAETPSESVECDTLRAHAHTHTRMCLSVPAHSQAPAPVRKFSSCNRCRAMCGPQMRNQFLVKLPLSIVVYDSIRFQ